MSGKHGSQQPCRKLTEHLEVKQGLKLSEPTPSDIPFPSKATPSKALKTVPTGNQAFKSPGLWGTLHSSSHDVQYGRDNFSVVLIQL